MSDKMREAFEKEFIAGSGLDWNEDQGRYVGSPFGCGADQGEYIANVRWQAWQAALAQQPESEPEGMAGSNEQLLLIDRVIRELDSGFVACNRCGEQEDTATLDCMGDLRRLRDLIYTSAPSITEKRETKS